jgi:hypothetical protein
MTQLPDSSGDRKPVLVVGIYLLDKENCAAATVAELSRSRDWAVEQKWVALGKSEVPQELAHVTVKKTDAIIPKFVLLNQLLETTLTSEYAYIIVSDDDIDVPPGFLDNYLRLVEQHDLALCQPARTHDSYIDHRFVEQLDGINARWTRFVEIGPLFSIRRDASPLILPFDEASPMGWGYDLVWPRVLADASLKMGIVDATPIAHSLRKPVTGYDWGTADQQRQTFLRQRPHLTNAEAFFIVESYA